MFQKVFEYAGPHKKGLYAATAVVLVSVLTFARALGGVPAGKNVGQSAGWGVTPCGWHRIGTAA